MCRDNYYEYKDKTGDKRGALSPHQDRKYHDSFRNYKLVKNIAEIQGNTLSMRPIRTYYIYQHGIDEKKIDLER